MAYNMLLFSITVLIYTLKWKENNIFNYMVRDYNIWIWWAKGLMRPTCSAPLAGSLLSV